MKPILIFCFLLPLSACMGQSGPADIFPGIFEGSFVYDPSSRSLVLAGGPSPKPNSSENYVWKWNGDSWSGILVSGPGGRDFFPGTFYPTAHSICFFGGPDEPRGVLWSFNGAAWNKILIPGLGNRDHHQMVYADHLNALVVYGGADEKQQLDTLTWLIKDGKATALHIPGPGIRYHFGMVYDKHRKKIVLYGGGKRPSELWEFDGTKWEQVIRPVSPGNKLYHRMVYDENAKLVILHGGWRNQAPKDPINSATPETWAWDGNAWTRLNEARIFPLAMGYDAARKMVVAYGRSESSTGSAFGIWYLEGGKWIKKAAYRLHNSESD